MSSPAEEFQMFLFLARFLFAFSFFSFTVCSKVFPTLAFSLLFILLVALSSPGNSCVLFNPFSADGTPVECLDDDTLNLPGSSFWRTLTIENVRILLSICSCFCCSLSKKVSSRCVSFNFVSRLPVWPRFHGSTRSLRVIPPSLSR